MITHANGKDIQGLHLTPKPSKDEVGSGGPQDQEYVLRLLRKVLDQYRGLVVAHAHRSIMALALRGLDQHGPLVRPGTYKLLDEAEEKARQQLEEAIDQACHNMIVMVQGEATRIFDGLHRELKHILDHGQGQDDASPPTSGYANGAAGLQNESFFYSLEQHQEESEFPSKSLPMVELDRQEPGEIDENSWVEQTPAPPLRQFAQTSADTGSPNRSPEVCLQLSPPLELKPLMKFYSALSGLKEVRVVQTMGSVDTGVSLYVRPKVQSCSLESLLLGLPGVRKVNEAPEPSRSDHPTLGVMLAPVAA